MHTLFSSLALHENFFWQVIRIVSTQHCVSAESVKKKADPVLENHCRINYSRFNTYAYLYNMQNSIKPPHCCVV